MSDFNLQNPYVYLMLTTSKEAQLGITQAVKSFVITAILQVVFIILLVSHMVVTGANQILPIALSISFTAFSFLQLKKATHIVNAVDIEQMISGDDYSTVNVNSEGLLDNIISLRESSGKVEFTKEFIRIQNVIFSIGCTFIFIILLSYLFK